MLLLWTCEVRLEVFRESPGTLEEHLWKRLKWQWPEDETQTCWWVANLDEDDKTKEAKLTCRSLACLRIELCKTRLATTEKLRNEWEKRLENNALAVDRIHEHRQLWFKAGGIDPELLATPNEYQLEAVAKTLQILTVMLDKLGPTGGLDSFVEELQAAASKLRVVSWEAIRKDRFSLTPKGLYDEIARNAQRVIGNWHGDYTRREARMRAPLEEDDKAKREAVKEVQSKETRPKDKYGLEATLLCFLIAASILDPDT